MKVDLSALEARYRNMPQEEFTLIKREDLTAEAQALYDREVGLRAIAAGTQPLEEKQFDRRKQKRKYLEGHICTACGVAFYGKPHRTFGGFGRFICQCGYKLTCPLPSATRTLYILVTFGMGVFIIVAIGQGFFAFPGILGIAVVYALAKDKRLRDEVFAARLRLPRA